MRTIKSKAKTIDGEWVEGCLYESNDSQYIKHPKSNTADEIDPNTLCQFTGLKDKNEKEVYFDDKVEFEEHRLKYSAKVGGFDAMPTGNMLVGVVSINKYFHSCIKVEGVEYHIDNLKYSEVIGNIHDKIGER